MEYQEENNYPKAFITTGIIAVLFTVLCCIIIMDNPPPQIDGTGGFVVNYGTSNYGMGKDINSTEEPSVSPKANQEQTNKVTPAPATPDKSQTETSNEKVVTQSAEDAPEVAANTKKSKKPATTELAKPQKREIVNQAALYKGAAKTGNGGGDGTTNTPGNQGSKNGSPLASNYGDGGNGNGVSGTQWSFVDMPSVSNPNRVPGTVVLDIVISANGTITSAKADRRSRMGDLDLINKCINAVMGSHLTSPKQASGNQNGQVTFKFDVD